jgi:hypothetical protein
MSNFNATQCFSGTCGLCIGCCGNVPHLGEKSTIDRDLYKFYRVSIDHEYDAYLREMDELKRKNYFTAPDQDSLLPKEYEIGRVYNGEEYTKVKWRLLRKNGGKRCNMGKCKIFHEHTHEYMRSEIFNRIPLYGCGETTLCAVCIRENGVKCLERI